MFFLVARLDTGQGIVPMRPPGKEWLALNVVKTMAIWQKIVQVIEIGEVVGIVAFGMIDPMRDILTLTLSLEDGEMKFLILDTMGLRVLELTRTGVPSLFIRALTMELMGDLDPVLLPLADFLSIVVEAQFE